MIGRVLAVVRFELRRTWTVARMAGWSVLAFFPPGVMYLMKRQMDELKIQMPRPELWGMILFGLVVEVVCMLGLLLWVTPFVHAEMEARSWPYAAVRPRGRSTILLGKYLTGVIWTVPAAWTGLFLSVLIVWPPDAIRLIAVLTPLVLLSCLAYGAVYALFAVFIPKRAMVLAVAYSLVFEFLVTLIPAVVNQITVNYRLRSLLFVWMGWWEDLPDAADVFLSRAPAWHHVAILLAGTATVLAIAGWILCNREYVREEER